MDSGRRDEGALPGDATRPHIDASKGCERPARDTRDRERHGLNIHDDWRSHNKFIDDDGSVENVVVVVKIQVGRRIDPARESLHVPTHNEAMVNGGRVDNVSGGVDVIAGDEMSYSHD